MYAYAPVPVAPVLLTAPVQLQPKLTIGQPGNAHEHEADHVANEVMRSATAKPCSCGGTCPTCAAKKQLQRKVINRSVQFNQDVPAEVHDVLRSGGQPLDVPTRSFMEDRLGHDFGQVRIHADAQAAQSARAVQARAYTVGHNIAFGVGQYDPGSDGGKHLLAHELTHVVQQSNGTPTQLQRVPDGDAATQLTIRLGTDNQATFELTHSVGEVLTSAGTASGLAPGTYQISFDATRHALIISNADGSALPTTTQFYIDIPASARAMNELLVAVRTPIPMVVEGAAPPSPDPTAEEGPVVDAEAGGGGAGVTTDGRSITPEEAEAQCHSLPIVTFPLRYTRFNESYIIASRAGDHIHVRMPMSSWSNGRELPGMHHMPPVGVVLGMELPPNQLVRIRQYVPRLNPFADDEVTEVCLTAEQLLDVSAQGENAIMMNIALTGVDALMLSPVGAAVGRGISAGVGYAGRRVAAPALTAAMIGTADALPVVGGRAAQAAITAVESRTASAMVSSVGEQALAQSTARVGAQALTDATLSTGSRAAVSLGTGGLGSTIGQGGAALTSSALGMSIRDAVVSRGMTFRAGGDELPLTPGGGIASDIPHVAQTTGTSCGPACGEMASGHMARAVPGSTSTTEAALMAHPEFRIGEGMAPWELEAALNQEAPIAGRIWRGGDFMSVRNPTVEQVKADIERMLTQSNGVAIVQAQVARADGSTYSHWVVLREVRGMQVLVHDPEAASATLEAITTQGFGRYVCWGDYVSSVATR